MEKDERLNMMEIDESLNMMEMDEEFYKEIGSFINTTNSNLEPKHFVKIDIDGAKPSAQSKKVRENILGMKKKLGVLQDPIDIAALRVIEAAGCSRALAALHEDHSNLTQNLQQIKSLPVQDAVWAVGVFECVQYEGNAADINIFAVQEICEGMRHTLKTSIGGRQGTSLSLDLLHLLALACLYPNVKKPRRPRFLRVVGLSQDLHSSQLELDVLNDLGIKVFLPGTSARVMSDAQSSVSDSTWFRSCTGCGRQGETGMFDSCSGCNAVFFCDSGCKTSTDHDMWCQCFKDFMKYETTIGTFPFSFCKETTSPSFNSNKHCDFLRRYGVYGKGIWRRHSKLMTSTILDAYGELDSPPPAIYCLRPDDRLLQGPPSEPGTRLGTTALTTWEGYYKFRGLGLDSPVAAVLHYAMTLYTIVASLLPDTYPSTFAKLQTNQTVSVHVIGAAQEVDMWRTFLECAHLLYPIKLHICFIGNEISAKVQGKQHSQNNLSVQFYSGLYHEMASTLPHGDLAVSFNAGLGAYETYKPTVLYLMENKIPTFCTDYCLASYQQSRQAVRCAKVAQLSTPRLNPFRSPLRMVLSDIHLPRYSNAVIYMLKPFESDIVDTDNASRFSLIVDGVCLDKDGL